ncbi:MAG: serine hydrolase domain-containing protein [Chthoniobacterales bacterium]
MTTAATASNAGAAKLGFSVQRLERLHRRIESFVDEGKHAGICALLFRKGEVADFFAAGLRDRQQGKPMRSDTIARIYSLTKIVSGVAALTLIEEGKLGLSHSIKDYLPEFSDMKIFVGGTAQHRELIPAEVAITVHHLFTHSSGYSYGDDEGPVDELYRSAGLEKAESLADLVKMLAALPLKREPGTMYEYGFSMDILARVVEVVSGRGLITSSRNEYSTHSGWSIPGSWWTKPRGIVWPRFTNMAKTASFNRSRVLSLKSATG